MTYFNTTNLTNPALSEYKRINSGQDATILKLFQKMPNHKMTPYVVAMLCDLHYNTPITSIRRSLNSLTKAGYLVKLAEKQESPMGRPNCTWILKTETV